MPLPVADHLALAEAIASGADQPRTGFVALHRLAETKHA